MSASGQAREAFAGAVASVLLVLAVVLVATLTEPGGGPASQDQSPAPTVMIPETPPLPVARQGPPPPAEQDAGSGSLLDLRLGRVSRVTPAQRAVVPGA